MCSNWGKSVSEWQLVLTCVGSSSDVGTCDVRSVVKHACLLPVGGGVAPDVRVTALLACRNWQIHVVLCTILGNTVFGCEALRCPQSLGTVMNFVGTTEKSSM
jgi:hypothetical protein